MEVIGYIRVSTDKQDLEKQIRTHIEANHFNLYRFIQLVHDWEKK